MNILVDTHIWIWWVLGDRKLSPKAKSIIADSGNTILLSSVSVWEAAIKVRIGKLPGLTDISSACEEPGFEKLPFLHRHAVVVAEIPARHGDPFDRALVAQARAEGLNLLSAYEELAFYSDLVRIISA